MEQKLKLWKEVVLKGFKSAMKVSWLLIKVYIPLSIITTILKQIGVIDFIAPYFSPLMTLMGLPGEASIAIFAGFINNIYAALATMTALDLTFRQVTILGIVIGLSHNLFVETAILTKLNMATYKIALFRIVVGFMTGIIMNQILPNEISGTIINPYSTINQFTWLEFTKGLLFNCLQIMFYMVILMLSYEILKNWNFSKIIKNRLNFIPKAIGFSDNAFSAWIVGLFIGIAYGAGILFQIAKDNALSHKDACLITIFLVLCHAIIEDTMLFVVVGGHFWWIAGIRLIMAIVVVKLLSIGDIYKKFLWMGLPLKIKMAEKK